VSGHVERAFSDVLRRIAVVMQAAGNPNQVYRYLLHMGRVEAFITAGFRLSSLPVSRLTHFTSIASQAGKTPALAEMLKAFVDDVLLISDQGLPAFSESRGLPSGGFLIQADPRRFLKAFMDNISIGVAQKSAVIFRRYAHNNHLPSQLIRTPTAFLPAALSRYLDVTPVKSLYLMMEAGSLGVTSLTDLTVQVAVVVTATVNGKLVSLRNGDWIELSVTFDSKVCYDTVEALKREGTMVQQFQLFMSSRFQVLDELVGELNDLHDASPADKARFLDEIVPAMFAHYVFTPNDFVDTGGTLAKFYQDNIRRMLGDFAQVQKDAHLTMSQDDLELCIEAIQRFSDQHFGGGQFINKTSRMRFN